ncbi:MAG: hypothetical protein PVH63_02625 [Balneolaceae bacterium]|jgi:hypothetical protein
MSEKQEQNGMKTIWYFVGLLMLTIGVIILGSGLYYVAYPPENPVVLHYLHPDIWWGSIMGIFGGILLWAFNGVTVEQ